MGFRLRFSQENQSIDYIFGCMGCMQALGIAMVNIQKAIENGPVEIVDFPIKNGDSPWQNVSSPDGSYGEFKQPSPSVVSIP